MILADWIIENNFCQILFVVLEFLSNGGLDCFFVAWLTKVSKITVTWLQSGKKERRLSLFVLTCPKLAKWTSTFNCSRTAKWPIWNLYISSHREARNIKFGQQVNIIERVSLGTPPRTVLMPLAHNYTTNLLILSYRGYCYQIWTVKATFW